MVRHNLTVTSTSPNRAELVKWHMGSTRPRLACWRGLIFDPVAYLVEWDRWDKA